ncbi:hypothetical protein ACFVX6_17495 [Streptomyces sp. NPDC058289]|uniref:hypothetical protein n=1 Tax=Streptomyces sp. NPDC058289 TaxID=3346425 RepID=UPI0036E7F2C7
MNSNRFRASALAVAMASLSGVMIFSQPASAAQTCTTNNRTQSMFGAVTEVLMEVPVCIEALPDNKVRGKVVLEWESFNDGQADMTSKRFNSFKVTSRLERRDPGGDVVVATKTCDFTANVNSVYDNLPSANIVCLTPSATLAPGTQWSGDSTLVYDIAGDDKGAITWHLNGSPLMS